MSKLEKESSIPVLLQEMTPEEKVDLLVGKSFFRSQEFPKYGIPSVLYLDGATGVNLMQYVGELVGASLSTNTDEKKEDSGSDSNNESGAAFMGMVGLVTNHEPLPQDMPEEQKAMIEKIRALVDSVRPQGEEPGCFPPGMLLGATWEPSVVYEIGEAVSREAMAYGVDILLGTPNTNIHRDPRNGRVFESFSEDPYLSNKMAPEFSKGVQDQGMVADVKHFAANNQETLRQGINEIISERAMREIYLPGFEAAVKEGGVGTVMSAYNSINGLPCAQNHWLLTEVLKNEWGFDGQVVSDWGAVYDQVDAVLAGNDMDMPGPRGKKVLYEAVADGRIPMERLDDAVTRMLKMILKTPTFCGRTYTTIDNEQSRKAAYRAAAEGITLLKNQALLPLSKESKVALIGHLSERFMESGSGSAQVDTRKFTSLVQEVKRKTSKAVYGQIDADTEVVIITAGASGQEGSDRPAMDLDVDDKNMVLHAIRQAKACNAKVVLLLNVAGPVDMREYIDDVDALLCLFFPGMQGAKATADILFGDSNPSGKLPLTFPKKYQDCPTSFNFPGEFGQVVYGEDIFVGYRYYDYKEIAPLYPFGYGLSYTSFALSDLTVSSKEYAYENAKPLMITVTVTNTGKVQGKEVVQVYIKDEKSTLRKPVKELKGFAKVELQPGEKKQVTIPLGERAFSSYDTALYQWTTEPGVYEIQVGNSSDNITLDARILVTGKNPYGYSLRSSIGFMAQSQEAMAVLEEVLGKAFARDNFISQAVYFTGTVVGDFLADTITSFAGTPEKAQKLRELLDEKLSMIPVGEEHL